MERKWIWITIWVLLGVSVSAGWKHAAGNRNPTVTLKNGALEGMRTGGEQNSAAFLGIPYAAPPVGELRWRPPHPVEKWSGTRSARQFGAACPQLRAGWFPYIGWNEDCLYLNVWTPQLSPKAKLPVLVYFHGGSNTQGYGQMTPLGPVFSKLGLVVVSANYRLGPFGFLAHPALTAESEHHSSGNYGLLDQFQVLRWVRTNIAQFGGDPKSITVMGQSAGAVDICLLMASPLAEGLFQRAILESGECESTLNEDIREPLGYNFINTTGEGAGLRLADDLGMSNGQDTLHEMRSVPAAQILDAWQHDHELHFDAIVDHWVVPEQPARIFAKGKQVHVPMLVGSNGDEATVFGHNDVKTVDQYKAYLREDTGKYAEQEFGLYPVPSDAEVASQCLRLKSDAFAYGAYSIARAVAQAGEKSYLYYFTYADTGKRAALGAHHGEELFFLSESFPNNWEPTPEDAAFGNLVRNYWAQFARTGDPNAPRATHWPAYKDDPGHSLELGRKVGSEPVSPKLIELEKIMKEIQSEVSSRP